jgi:hypothetical protein
MALADSAQRSPIAEGRNLNDWNFLNGLNDLNFAHDPLLSFAPPFTSMIS